MEFVACRAFLTDFGKFRRSGSHSSSVRQPKQGVFGQYELIMAKTDGFYWRCRNFSRLNLFPAQFPHFFQSLGIFLAWSFGCDKLSPLPSLSPLVVNPIKAVSRRRAVRFPLREHVFSVRWQNLAAMSPRDLDSPEERSFSEERDKCEINRITALTRTWWHGGWGVTIPHSPP